METSIEAIETWVQKNRPDLLEYLDPVFQGAGDLKMRQAFELLLSVGFAAGREYQKNNPEAP